MSKHEISPAPWTYKVFGEFDGRDLCDVIDGTQQRRVADSMWLEDARLISAAPDLLAALQEISALEGSESSEWDAVERLIPKMCEIARAAIEKATRT